MKVSVPFGYYRREPGQLVSTPVVEFIDAEAPELSQSEVRAVAYYSVHGEPLGCLRHEGDFLVPLDALGRPVNAAHMPSPARKRSLPEMAFQLTRLMPMSIGEPIQLVCVTALTNGIITHHHTEGTQSPDREGRIARAKRVAESFVIVGGHVWRKVPEPKLKLTVNSNSTASLGVYFGGTHWNENGKSKFEDEYVLPFTIGDQLSDFVELRQLNMQDLSPVGLIPDPEVFTFSAALSLAETAALTVLRKTEKHLGSLDRDNIVRWMDLREMAAPFNRFDQSVWNDIRGDVPAAEILELVAPLARAVPDETTREIITAVIEWADLIDAASNERRVAPAADYGVARR